MENPRVWFRSISLENVRSFGRKQTIYFTEDGTENGPVARWNVLLGDNGTGKTTVLKGLVVMVQNQHEIHETGVSLTELWRFGKEDIGAIINGIVINGDENLTTGFNVKPLTKHNGSIFQFTRTYEIEMTLSAYRASRQISSSAISTNRLNLINDFFLEENNLTNAEEWIVQADYLAYKDHKLRDRFNNIIEILKTLLREEISDVYIDTESGTPKVFFKTHYGDVRLHELSLGYKTLIAWTVDFAKGLLDRYPDSPNPLAEPAVCLVDEIDLHLHPKSQRTIIKFLTETFSNTQFIVTAHSPLVVQAAEDYNANLIVLKREGDETVVTSGLEVRNWRVDQILASDLFEGIPPRAPESEKKMIRRRSLLIRDNLSVSEKQELNQLNRELGILPASESWEAVKAMDIIKRAILNKE